MHDPVDSGLLMRFVLGLGFYTCRSVLLLLRGGARSLNLKC